MKSEEKTALFLLSFATLPTLIDFGPCCYGPLEIFTFPRYSHPCKVDRLVVLLIPW
jgi:hypothetical protein